MAETQRAGKPKAQGSPPVTEDRLKALLDDLRRHIAAEINSFKEEIHGVSVRLHDTEISTAAHEAHINSLETELTKTKNDLTQTQHQVAAMEDRRRWNNVKIKGLSESVTMAEIPHLIRRLLSSLFAPK
ncbi:Hypothetical predicted protein [Pelobates cultripes]|uniref:Uncharacterized protein n=1 Tax=Pelobates cultripes TaxID=61616 RepID=A0AAD1RBR0_PELCU|nr:Hypothetical predicted protein [Pelobates cultripes]